MTEEIAYQMPKIAKYPCRLFQDIFLYICCAFDFSVKKQPSLFMSFNLKGILLQSKQG